MQMIEFTVYGTPAPQGSKKLVGRDRKGRGILVESSAKVKPWREAVKYAALEVHDMFTAALTGPVSLEVVFSLTRPKSAPRRVTLPATTPDLSKLIRSTEDALTDAGVWEDDSRVVRCVASKVFAGSDSPDALPVPGAVIRIQQVSQ